MSNIKILLSYHKTDHLFKDDILTPIHAGRANALKKMNNDNPNLKWLLENMDGDNTGDNISEKNGIYNEMSTVYWAWKNYEILGNPDYIGFMHYRRHFIFKDMDRPVYDCLDIDDDYFNKINYSPEIVQDLMNNYDFVCTKPHYRSSMYEHYEKNHDIHDLDCAVKILEEKYPDFSALAKQYLEGHDAYFCNMFIFSRNDFFEYAQWFFDIAFELEKRVDMSGKRLFVSEWLTGIFITYLISKNKVGKFLPTMIAEGDHTISIVMASDDNYAVPTSVTITSILENAKKRTYYDFYILQSGDFSERHKAIMSEITEKHERCTIKFIDMRDKYQNVKMNISHITAATYYRLQLPSLLKDVNKCIYLDVDLIVNDDLSELFRTSVDDRYVAGVRAPGYYYPDSHREKHEEELGIKLDQYINAGVLLLNLAKMRQDNLEEKFSKLLKKNYSSQDQDIINVACYGKIRHLQFKYNVMTKYKLNYETEYNINPALQMCFGKEEWDYGRKCPSIIHFADRSKPWVDMSITYSSLWWKYALKVGLDEDMLMKYIDDSCESATETRAKLNLYYAHRRDLQHALHCTQQSVSYRIGRAITFVPRKIRGGINCMKDHGVRYTFKRFWKKLMRRG